MIRLTPQKYAEKFKKRKADEEASPPKSTTRRRYELSCVIREMILFGYVSLQNHLERRTNTCASIKYDNSTGNYQQRRTFEMSLR